MGDGGDWSVAPGDVDAVESWLSRQMVENLTMSGLRLDDLAERRLREVAAEMEAEVVVSGRSHKSVPFIVTTSSGPVHADFTLSREPGSSDFKVTLSGGGFGQIDRRADVQPMHLDMPEPGAVRKAGLTILVVVSGVMMLGMGIVIMLMMFIVSL